MGEPVPNPGVNDNRAAEAAPGSMWPSERPPSRAARLLSSCHGLGRLGAFARSVANAFEQIARQSSPLGKAALGSFGGVTPCVQHCLFTDLSLPARSLHLLAMATTIRGVSSIGMRARAPATFAARMKAVA